MGTAGYNEIKMFQFFSTDSETCFLKWNYVKLL